MATALTWGRAVALSFYEKNLYVPQETCYKCTGGRNNVCLRYSADLKRIRT